MIAICMQTESNQERSPLWTKLKQENFPQKLYSRQWVWKILSIAARNLSVTLSQTTQDEEFLQACEDYITDATADKIDGYSVVAAY